MKKGIVVFDVEGVVVPKRRFLPFEATRQLGFLKFLKVLYLGFLYEIGISSLESALQGIYRYFQGSSVRELRRHFLRLPLLPGVHRVFRRLNREGWKIALISSGLPQSFIQELAGKLEVDYAYGLNLEIVDGRFTGKIGGTAIKRKGKAVILKKILQRENLPPEKCVLVVDDRNNLPMFPYAHLRIGYHPDFLMTLKSDHIVNGELTGILPLITRSQPPSRSLSTNQILRSAIHLSGFTLPFISIYLINRYHLAFLILIITLLYLIAEFLRITGQRIPFFTTVTRHAAVQLELYEFTAAPIFYALAIILSLAFFPPNIAYPSITVLTLGDGFASIIGQKLGRNPYPFNKAKNLEGTLSGMTLAFLGASLFTTPLLAFTAATVGMIAECLPTPVNDNLLVPFSTAVILTCI